ncbi:organic hydroperoxide resistance protein [Vineibacter terrae]|uniref:Organic hydroperoxide resistance protein n=1 Tax=Vineibacter terrae TaxID=2586908 RepID=A0A5C8PR88_9HYPH|nr:organic hydroperoxide resistance protein [Vineibacter terrae]TXL77531.1 organic hydroperoxide resistance protein [Vineibacter terrae]
MKIIYTAHAEVTGGRDGHARSSDGALDVQLGRPKEFGGGAKPGTNPEQLFAAGYAACFESAVRYVAGQRKVAIQQSSVKAAVGIGPREQGGFGLEVELRVSLPGVDRAVAEDLVKTAHEQICPYSNATRGNVPVKVSVE